MEVLYARPRSHPNVVRRLPAKKPDLALPPAMEGRIDVEVQDIDEVSTLLGAFIQTSGSMKASRLARLKAMVGEIPSVDKAKEWKSALKQLRSELVEACPSR